MDLLSKKPSFTRFYLIERNDDLIDDFKHFVEEFKLFIFNFYNIPKNNKIINFNKNYIKELEYKIGTIINQEKQLIDTSQLKKEFIIKLSNFEKIRIISEFLSIFEYINGNFINYIDINKTEVKTHESYRKFLIPRLNNTINRLEKLRLSMGELAERPLDYIEYKYLRTLFNKKIVLIKQVTRIPVYCINNFIKSDKFDTPRINSEEGQNLFCDLNLLLNYLDDLRLRILKYFEYQSFIVEHGMFEKYDTNRARKTDFEKSKLQLKLQTNLHNTRTII